MIHARREVAGEEPRSAGELENVARAVLPEPVNERRVDRGRVGVPARVLFRATVVAAATKPPFVVFRGARLIVVDLFLKNVRDSHRRQ